MRYMISRIAATVALAAGLLTPTTIADAAAPAIAINFDTGDAPCSFRATSPLRERYAKLGVHFGVGGKGGKVLDQCVRLGYDHTVLRANTGRQYLVLDTENAGVGYQEIKLDTPHRNAQVWLAEGLDNGPSHGDGVQFNFEAYRGDAFVGGSYNGTPGWGNTVTVYPAKGAPAFDTLRISCYESCRGAFIIDDFKVWN